MRTYKIICIIIVFVLSSCISLVKGNRFKQLDNQSKQSIKVYSDTINLKNNLIYEITGDQLKRELKKQNKSLVYIFANNCSSDNCLPLKTVEEYAEKNNLTLFLIMSSFYKMETSLSQNIESTLFAIKATHYGNINNNKYIQSFKEDIGYYDYVEKKNQKWLGNYIFYKKDSIIDIKINPINAHNNK